MSQVHGYASKANAIPTSDPSVVGVASNGFHDRVDRTIRVAVEHLKQTQEDDGHWVFDLEADATIPAEYIMLGHFIGEPDPVVDAKLARYLLDGQGEHGGWPLFFGGEFDMSASVKAYFALKLNGEDPDAPHMKRAREAILSRGGAAHCNVFTRIALALFGQVPWRAVPEMPVGLMLLPDWSPFHLNKVSYWTRTVLVPLLILMTRKPIAINPGKVDIQELFVSSPFEQKNFMVNPTGASLGAVFLALDRVLRTVTPHFPKKWENRSIEKAVGFITERLNGDDGLGGIFPAMANAVMAFHCLGYDKDHPDYMTAKNAVKGLLSLNGQKGFCQPCLSPVWDTALAAHAMMEADVPVDGPIIRDAVSWLLDRQILDLRGDWSSRRPDLAPGGWAFQYNNAHYPDTDDTAAVALAIHRAGGSESEEAVKRAVEWTIGMQSANGGWGAFDADNTHYYLNHIPFADHGALLDPPTADVTARCVGLLAQYGYDKDDPVVAKALHFLREEQEDDGSWFGRWGTNYIYGTWSVLSAFNAVGEDPRAPHIRAAIDWLKANQNDDGGWGEDCTTYWPDRQGDGRMDSMPSQTAWALLGLMAAGEVDSDAVVRGVDFLVKAPRDGGQWKETHYNAVGFPRVFYLKYHGYGSYFPLWALARYRKLKSGNASTTAFGI